MTVGPRLGAKARSRFSRRGPGDDQVCILPGEDEEAAAGAPRPEQEREEGAGGRKVRFALLPDSYQPLRPPPPPGKRPYGKRLRKYGKVRRGGERRAPSPGAAPSSAVGRAHGVPSLCLSFGVISSTPFVRASSSLAWISAWQK